MQKKNPQDVLRSCCKARYTVVIAMLVAVIASGCASSRPPATTAVAILPTTAEKPAAVPEPEPIPIPEEVDDSVPAPRWDLPDLVWSVEHLIREEVDEWFGTPHRMGGEDKSGVDCSAFVLAIYRDLFGIDIPRTTSEQVHVGEEISSDELQPGDLVFFRPGRRSRHVGIYLQNGEFAHASESRGVTISRLDEAYWKRAYWTSRRILEDAVLIDEAILLNDEESYVPETSLLESDYFEADTLSSARSGW